MPDERPVTQTQVWAEFSCFRGSDLDLDQISSAVDLTPTKTWKEETPAYLGEGPTQLGEMTDASGLPSPSSR